VTATVVEGAPGERRGGVLLRVGGALRFVSSSVAFRIAPPPRVTPVPGAPAELLGVAPYDGMIVPVIAIGPARREMIVCQHAGELLGLVGGEVLVTGTFDLVPGRTDVVTRDGEPAQAIDVAAVYAKVQAAARSWTR